MRKDETIVTDISEAEKGNVSTEEELAPTSRDIAMQGILASRSEEQQLEREAVVEPEDDQLEDDSFDDKFVTVKINGRSSEVEREKVESAGGVEAYQRNAAASEKQREVADREAALKKREEDLAKLEASLLQQKKEPEKDQNVNGDFGRDFADQIFDDPDEVAKKANELEARTRKAEENSQKALDKLEAGEAKERQKVIDHFHTNYIDIATDPALTMTLNGVTGSIAEENPHFTQQQIVDAAAKHVYDKYGLTPGGKETNKENTRKPPKTPSRATNRKPPEKEIKVKTPLEVIQDLSKGRSPMRY